MNLPTIESPIALAGILALVIFELVKRKDRRADMNGSNPVVKAIARLDATMKEEHGRTREKIGVCFDAMDKRLFEHEGREEKQWSDVQEKLWAVPKRGEK